jgi:elongation factor P--beta-lysine ligase
MFEWYCCNVGLEELMVDIEAMVRFVAFEYGKPFSEAAFRRLMVKDAMKQYANLDFDVLLENREAMAQACWEHRCLATGC